MLVFSIDHFISANLFLGFNVKFRHTSILGYISYVRFNVDILNLVLTLYNLRIVLSFIRKLYFNKGFL